MRSVCRTVLIASVALMPLLASAQEATISGRVTTAAGVPLVGATVSIPVLGVGGVTREGGTYAFTIPSARVAGQTADINARLIGYKPRTTQITIRPGTIAQDFSLEANPLQLGELVITGAGTATAAEKLGTSRTTVSPELIVKSNESNFVQALAGTAANVHIASSAGDPGAGSSITIRGLRTINGTTEPLFVVDGVPMNNSTYSTYSFDPIDAGATTSVAGQVAGGELQGTSSTNRLVDLNPNDVESVEILRGAAASAIYGARAANGVVLITTKHGQSGQTRYSLRSSLTSDEVTKFYPLQTTYGQGLGNVTSAATRSWGPKLTTPVFDHAKEAFDKGYTSDNTMTVSGGNDRTTFYLSGNLNKNTGVFVGPNNYYNRSTVRLNASHHVSDAFVVGGNISYADTRGHFTQRGNNTNGLLLGLLRTPPGFNNKPWLDTVTGLHRAYMVPNATPATAGKTRTFDNPFFDLYEQLNTATTSRSFGNINAEYTANNWLKFNYTLGADYSNDERLEGCPAECSGGSVGGTIIEGKLVDYSIDHNLTGTANWSLSTDFSGTFTLGQNLNARTYRTFSVVGRQLIAPQPFSISNTLTRDPPSDYQTEIRNESYFGQLTADLYNQLFLTVALRNDGSSTFGADNRRNMFPKGSVAWVFTNKYKPSFLTFGKLRLAVGSAGQEPDPYLTSPTFSGSTLVGSISQGTGFGPTQSGLGGLFSSFTKPAATLKPERTRETEWGADFGFWDDKGDLSATFYSSRTTDVILVLPTAPSSGYSSEAKNGGVFSNSGTELALNLRPVKNANSSWEIGAGWGNNKSIVESLAGADFLLTDNVLIATVAKAPDTNATGGITKKYALGAFQGNGWVRCGLSPDDAVPGIDLAALCAGKPKGTVFIDDGTHGCSNAGMPCRDDVVRILGDPNPKWLANLHSTYRFKGLEVSGLLDFRHGGQVYNGTKGALWSYGTHKETEARAICTGAANAQCTGNEHVFGDAGSPYEGPVVGPGAGTKIPIGENWFRTSGIAACGFVATEEPCLEDASYVKLREVSVAYTLDQAWVTRNLGLSSIDIRLAGRNLKTWTNYTGLDPETTVGGSTTHVGGTDYFNLPLTRSFVFTVGLNR